MADMGLERQDSWPDAEQMEKSKWGAKVTFLLILGLPLSTLPHQG